MASGEKVGSVYYEVDADTAPLLSAAKKVDDAMSGMQDSFKKTDDAMAETVKQMGWYVDNQGKMRDASGRFVSAQKQAQAATESFGSKLKETGDSAGFIGSKLQKAVSPISTIGTKMGETSAYARAMANSVKNAGDSASSAAPKLTQTAEAAKKVANESSGASAMMGRLTAAVGAYLSLQTLQAMATIADSYGQYASRIKNATTSSEEYEMVQARLLATANGTYRALSEAQEVYLSTTNALKLLGYTTSEQLDISESLSYGFVRNATAADRAEIAMGAYSRALSKGRVDADAWEMILIALPNIADDVAAATGKSAEEIRKLGTEGKLSIEALNEALIRSLDENKRVADQMAVSTKDATTQFMNALTVFIGKVDEAAGGSKAFEKAIGELSAILQDPATVQAAADLATGIVTAMNSIIKGARETVNVVRWMAEEVAAAMHGAAAGDIVRLEGELEKYQKARNRNSVVRFFDGYTDKELDEKIASRKVLIADYYKYAQTQKTKATEAPKEDKKGRGLIDPVAKGGGGGRKGGGGGGSRKTGKSEAERELERQAEAAARYIQSLQEQASAIKNATAQEKLMADVMSKKVTLQDEQMAQAVKLAEVIDQRSNADVIKDLTEQLTNASLSAKELAEKQAVLRLNKWATPEQIEEVKLLAHQIGYAQEKAAKLAEIGPNVMQWIQGDEQSKFGGREDEAARFEQEAEAEKLRHEARHQRLLEALEVERVTREKYHQIFEELELQHAERMGEIDRARTSMMRQQYGEAFGVVADILKQAQGEQSSAYKAMFAVSKAFAIADATVNAYNAISKAWASAPFPANLAAVASTAPQVMGVVSAISSATMGGGRMYGGNVAANSMYRVNEGGAPEIFNAANGQQFLMPNTRGEVVSNSDATSGGSKANVTVNVIESAEKAGNVNQSTDDQGNDVINVWIADFMGDGRTAGAIRGRFGLNSQGI